MSQPPSPPIRGTRWVTNPTDVLEPIVSATGFGAEKPETVIELFNRTKVNHGSKTAMGLKRAVNGVVPAQWKLWTWAEYYNDCLAFAKTLVHLNVDNYKIVNILGFNSPEWLIANNGAIIAGCIAAGIYTTNTADACHYITEHSKAEVVVLEDNKQLQKYSKIGNKLPNLKALVVWMEQPDPAIVKECPCPVYFWSDFLALGNAVADSVVDARGSSVKPGNCSTLIYTSGTTGPPKAVMISHDNVTWTTNNMLSHYVDMNHTDRIVSFLPLSHIAAQLIDIHVPMRLGCATYFCQPDALKGSLTVTMKDVRPTCFFGVPRVWEKIQEKLVQVGRDLSPLKKRLGAWAKGLAAEKNKHYQFGGTRQVPFGFGCANSLILSNIKAQLGLDKCRACFTAAAPIAKETLEYFGSLDIPVYEVFGQSECTGPHTVSCATQWKIGYCGRPMFGTESMIAPGTNELCYRGRHIFMGYMYMPDKTAETIDGDGYLHSGDVAEFDSNDVASIPTPSGFMKITGRIKELIITAGGENIPPVLIENEMKFAMNALSNCMVVGDRRKYLAMLISVKTEVDKDTGLPTDVLSADSLHVCKEIGSNAKTVSEVAADPLWTAYFERGMKAANKKTTSNAQIVQKWKLLSVDFSEKENDLTPTLKLKRNEVTKKYAALVDSIYADDKE